MKKSVDGGTLHPAAVCPHLRLRGIGGVSYMDCLLVPPWTSCVQTSSATAFNQTRATPDMTKESVTIVIYGIKIVGLIHNMLGKLGNSFHGRHRAVLISYPKWKADADHYPA